MRKVLFLCFTILVVVMLNAFAEDLQKVDNGNEDSAESAIFSCIASAPATAQINQTVQFYGNATTGVVGTLVGVDAIAGNMCYIPADATCFNPGSSVSEPGRNSDEDIAPPYTSGCYSLFLNSAVMETEVTRRMWAELKNNQGSLPTDPTATDYGDGLNNPVQNVSWCEALLFANLLSLQNGLTPCYYTNSLKEIPIDANNYTGGSYYCDFYATGYRLPTEVEWEYFCRAGTRSPFFADETLYGADTFYLCTPGVLPSLETIAVFCANSNGTTQPVGSKIANPWNLRDVHGNVSEWCWNAYYSDYTSGFSYIANQGSSTRTIRGGSWRLSARYCRSAKRVSANWFFRNIDTGFRLVRTL